MTKMRPIPYERQEDSRKCGAAALSMVYRSFGQDVRQTDLWPAISTDKWSAKTHLLAKDAIQRGFPAIVMQASDPLPTLGRCHEHGIPAILNHRLNPKSHQGHFSVFLGKFDDNVVIHDPFRGPACLFKPEQFRDLWTWNIGSPEITGNVLVALAPEAMPAQPCPECGETMPDVRQCVACGQQIPLAVAGALGCGNPDCSRRTWRRIFCPFCDQQHRRLVGAEPEAPPGSKSLVCTITDFVKEIVNMAKAVTIDPAQRESLEEASAYLDEAGQELEEGIREQVDGLKEAHKNLSKIGQAAQNAAVEMTEKLEKKKATVAEQRAAHKAARKKARMPIAPLPSVPAPANNGDDDIDGDKLRNELIGLCRRG